MCLPDKSEKLSAFNFTKDSTISETDLQSRQNIRPMSSNLKRYDHKDFSINSGRKENKMRRVLDASEPKLKVKLDGLSNTERKNFNFDSKISTDAGSTCKPDKRPQSVQMRIRRPLSEESINLHDTGGQSLNNIQSHTDIVSKNLADIYNQDINIRTMATQANKSLNEQRQQLENMGEKDELELILKKAFVHYDYNNSGYLNFNEVQNLFDDASNELNADLFTTPELKGLFQQIPGKVNDKVSFDSLFKVVGPLLEQKLIE